VSAAAVIGGSADPDRRWLETLAAACERVLARDADPADWSYQQIREDVAKLLTRVRAELEGER
jgi:ElaB/YqjD/DUF883 family membrane-anchored ribosome-binding protein